MVAWMNSCAGWSSSHAWRMASSPGALAGAVNDIRHAKTDPIQAIDGVTNRLTQKMVAVLATLKKPLSSSAGKA